MFKLRGKKVHANSQRGKQ